MPDTKDNTSIVTHQNFDDVMLSLADFTERAKNHNAIEKITPRGKVFKSKTPTIDDINKVISDVDGHLVDLKNFNVEVLDVLTGIYVAIAALDKEHISGILISANLAKAASEQAVKNVESISGIIKILKSQEHLRDIDQSWIDLERHKEVLKTLSEYKNELQKIQHLKDLDKLWEEKVLQAKAFEQLEQRIREITKLLEEQGKSIANTAEAINKISAQQQAFVESASKHFSEQSAAIDRHLEERERLIQKEFKAQSEQLSKDRDYLNQKVNDLAKAQGEALSFIEKTQTEKLFSIERAQTEELEKIRTAQTEHLEKIESAHSERLTQLSQEQSEKLKEINDALENEKSALKNTVATLSQKVKVAYIVAACAGGITIIHLLLNIFGVL